MNTLIEVLVEPAQASDSDAIAHIVADVLEQTQGVTLESYSSDTVRNLTGEEVAISYLIGIASSVTVDIVLTHIRSRLTERKLKAELHTTDMGNADELQKSIVKQQAISLVELVAPDDVFVVEEGFDAMAAHWDQAVAQDEGRFSGAEVLSTFSALIAPFLLGLLVDTAKDVVKDQAKKAVSRLVDKHRQNRAPSDDLQSTRKAIDTAIEQSKLTTEQKQTLRDGFGDIYVKLKPPA